MLDEKMGCLEANDMDSITLAAALTCRFAPLSWLGPPWILPWRLPWRLRGTRSCFSSLHLTGPTISGCGLDDFECSGGRPWKMQMGSGVVGWRRDVAPDGAAESAGASGANGKPEGREAALGIFECARVRGARGELEGRNDAPPDRRVCKARTVYAVLGGG